MTKSTFSIELGALSKPIHEQLGRPIEYFEKEEAHAKAISRLHIHGLLTDGETLSARKRLMKIIRSKVEV